MMSRTGGLSQPQNSHLTEPRSQEQIYQELKKIYPNSQIPEQVINRFYILNIHHIHHKNCDDRDWDLLRDLSRNVLYSQWMTASNGRKRQLEDQIRIMWEMIFHVYDRETGIHYVQSDLDLFSYLILSGHQDWVLERQFVAEDLAKIPTDEIDNNPWIFYLYFRSSEWLSQTYDSIRNLYDFWRVIVEMGHLLQPSQTKLAIFESVFEYENQTIRDIRTKLMRIVRAGQEYYQGHADKISEAVNATRPNPQNPISKPIAYKWLGWFNPEPTIDPEGSIYKFKILSPPSAIANMTGVDHTQPDSHADHEDSVSYLLILPILIICLL